MNDPRRTVRRRQLRSRTTVLAALATASTLALAACSSATDPPPSSSQASSAAPTSASSPAPSPSASPSGSGSSSASRTLNPGRAGVLTSGLDVPWGVVFLPGGDALVSQRDDHRLVRVTPAGGKTVVGTVPGVEDDAGEGGLLGLALSPSFARDNLIYAYYTAADDNRVVRFTLSDNRMGDVSTVFTGIPKAGNHNGGRLLFGPDGLLYVTAGDAAQPQRAPDPGYLGGKVLRMTADGKPAPGNPDADSVVFTRGHRNPQGLAFGPGGALYEAEFGQNSLDEINRLQAGNDYGWPTVEGTEGPDGNGKTAPLLTFSTRDASPSGLAYAGGSLYLAALGGERLYRIAVQADGSLGRPQALLSGEYGRLRTVVVAPDGSLWVTTSNQDGRGDPSDDDDRIIRIPLT